MFFAAMIDMAKTPEQVKEETAPAKALSLGDRAPTVPVYPWGLCIRLEDDTLAKLNLGQEMPSVGEMIHLCAMAKVTSVSENESEDGNGGKTTRRCIELQITHLAVEDEDQEGAAVEAAEQKTAARRSRFYGPDAAA
jgi:hypothetical protein